MLIFFSNFVCVFIQYIFYTKVSSQTKLDKIGFKIGFSDNAYKMKYTKGFHNLVSKMEIFEKNFQRPDFKIFLFY